MIDGSGWSVGCSAKDKRRAKRIGPGEVCELEGGGGRPGTGLLWCGMAGSQRHGCQPITPLPYMDVACSPAKNAYS